MGGFREKIYHQMNNVFLRYASGDILVGAEWPWLEGDFLDDEDAVLPFPFGVGADIGVILGDFVDDAAIGGVEVELLGVAGLADFANPTFSLVGDAFGALALIVGDVNIDAGELSAAANEGHRDDVLEGAEVVGFATDEERIHGG